MDIGTKTLEASLENCKSIQPVQDDWTIEDIAKLLARSPEDLVEVCLNAKTPIGRQGDVVVVLNKAKEFVNPTDFGIELKEINTNYLQKSTLKGNDHRLVSVNNAFKIYEGSGVNMYEAYEKNGMLEELKSQGFSEQTLKELLLPLKCGEMYFELGEGTFLAHAEHGQAILPRGFYECRIQNCVNIQGEIRKQLD